VCISPGSGSPQDLGPLPRVHGYRVSMPRSNGRWRAAGCAFLFATGPSAACRTRTARPCSARPPSDATTSGSSTSPISRPAPGGNLEFPPLSWTHQTAAENRSAFSQPPPRSGRRQAPASDGLDCLCSAAARLTSTTWSGGTPEMGGEAFDGNAAVRRITSKSTNMGRESPGTSISEPWLLRRRPSVVLQPPPQSRGATARW
jgi:hypothetical protein